MGGHGSGVLDWRQDTGYRLGRSRMGAWWRRGGRWVGGPGRRGSYVGGGIPQTPWKGVGCLGHEGGDFWVVAAAEGGALGVGRATFLKRAMQRRAISPSGPGRVPRGGLVAGFRRGGIPG